MAGPYLFQGEGGLLNLIQGDFFFTSTPQFQYQKKIANQQITVAVPVNPINKKGRDWLLGGYLFGSEIGGLQ